MATRRTDFWFGILGGIIALVAVTVHGEQRLRIQDQARALDVSRQEVASIKDQIDHLQTAFSAVDRESRDAIVALTDRLSPDPSALSNELLAPAVQLNGSDKVGSGTLVCSRVDAVTGEAFNYVLTAWHVVRDIIRGDEAKAIDVRLFQSADEPQDLTGYLVAKNPRIDAALVRISSDEIFEHVAMVLPPAAERCVAVWSAVYCVGCPLGNDPIPTSGTVSSLHNQVGGANYWMINAPAYYGNSGGAVFLADSRELIGVFSKVYTSAGNVVSHMGLMTPISSIHQWLEEEGLDHVLASSESARNPSELSCSVASKRPKLLADNGILAEHRGAGKNRDF